MTHARARRAWSSLSGRSSDASAAWRLRSHLWVLVAAAMVLTLTIVFVSGLFWRLPMLERDSQRQLRQQTADVAARLELLLLARQARLALLAEVIEGRDPAADAAVLHAHAGAGRSFDALYLLSPQGRVRAAALPGVAGAVPDDWHGRDLSRSALFRALQDGRPSAWHGSHPALSDGAARVGLARRRADGQVLVGELAPAFLPELLAASAAHQRSEIWVVDSGGNVLADTAQGRHVGPLPPAGWPLLEAARRGARLPHEMVHGSQRHWVGLASSAPLGWYFIGRAPAGWSNPAVRELLPYAVTVFLGCLALGLAITSVFGRRLVRALQVVTERAARTAQGGQADTAWPQGNVAEFNAVSRDLQGMAAALQARQQKFRAIFDALPVPTAVTDADNGGRLLDVNEAWCRLFGHRHDDVLGRTGAEVGLFSAERRGWMHKQLQADSLTLEFPMRRSDGQALQMLSSCQRVRLPDAHWLIWTHVDVTPLRAAERELRELNQQLERHVAQRTLALTDANAQLARKVAQLRLVHDGLVDSEKMAALGALVAGVAHELNTPLGNGVMAVSAVADEARRFRDLAQAGVRRADLQRLIDSVAQGIDIAQRNLRRATDLAQSFKQVAVDQASAQRRRFELGEVVHEMVVSLQPSISRTPYRIETEVPATGLLLDSYPGALGQTIGNLIQNAVLHGFDGREHGTVRLSGGRTDDGQMWLHVADDGRGIAPEHIARIFEPFMTTRMGRGGTGLGLHISYNAVVNVLGGTLSVRSVPGEGACFMLRLPSQAPHPAPAAAEPAP